LVAAHRQRRELTQNALAEAARISPDMVAKIEHAASGARFPVIERIAKALAVDPSELFTTEVTGGPFRRGTHLEITTRLASLSEEELQRVVRMLDVLLTGK